MTTVARCAIYDRRPEMCRRYPQLSDYVPSACTFVFNGGSDRQGECACNEGACCAIPRRDGEPEAPPLSEEAGGLPCKHLVYEEEQEKVASGTAHASGVEHGTRHLLRVLGQ